MKFIKPKEPVSERLAGEIEDMSHVGPVGTCAIACLAVLLMAAALACVAVAAVAEASGPVWGFLTPRLAFEGAVTFFFAGLSLKLLSQRDHARGISKHLLREMRGMMPDDTNEEYYE